MEPLINVSASTDLLKERIGNYLQDLMTNRE